MIKVMLIFLLSISYAYADESSYWSIDIPAIDGATDAFSERNERLYTVSLSYDISVKDTRSVYDFYEEFFNAIGWESQAKAYPGRVLNEYQGDWSAQRVRQPISLWDWFNFTAKGSREVYE